MVEWKSRYGVSTVSYDIYIDYKANMEIHFGNRVDNFGHGQEVRPCAIVGTCSELFVDRHMDLATRNITQPDFKTSGHHSEHLRHENRMPAQSRGVPI